jgi:PAS domain S-box-containing protein
MNAKSKESPIPANANAILDSISDGVFTVDAEWRITSFNRAAETITGVKRVEAVGQLCSEVFRCSMCESACALGQTLRTRRPIIGRTGFIVTAEGRRIPISVSTAILTDETGKVIGGAETFRDLSELEALREELTGRRHAGEMVSRSPLMQRIFEVLPVIAVSPSTVLVTGETGTGKEVLARTLHALSLRKKGPFVAVNCGALPDTLLESELFGYQAGAFTGATRDKPGRIALAKGGTLFLDEIGEMSQPMQVRLLRVLQERSYEPLGSTRSESADVRIIVATHRDLSGMMKQGEFREDLYYRVNVIRIELPPLRNRKEDIPDLIAVFIERQNLLQQKRIRGIAPEALSLLMAHAWPGNIRELENVIERAVILSTTDEITMTQLPAELTATNEVRAVASDLRTSRQQAEKYALLRVLERNGFQRNAAARELGIHKSTLFRRIKVLGLELPPRRNP